MRSLALFSTLALTLATACGTTDDTEVDGGTDVDGGTETDTEADSETDTEADSETDTEADSETDTEADSEGSACDDSLDNLGPTRPYVATVTGTPLEITGAGGPGNAEFDYFTFTVPNAGLFMITVESDRELNGGMTDVTPMPTNPLQWDLGIGTDITVQGVYTEELWIDVGDDYTHHVRIRSADLDCVSYTVTVESIDDWTCPDPVTNNDTLGARVALGSGVYSLTDASPEDYFSTTTPANTDRTYVLHPIGASPWGVPTGVSTPSHYAWSWEGAPLSGTNATDAAVETPLELSPGPGMGDSYCIPYSIEIIDTPATR